MKCGPCAPEVKRQAVVLIHGIGEQRPMETLRGFVDALLKAGNRAEGREDRPYHSKPDTISDSYELRRIKLRKFEEINKDWPYETDFYEYYWAHRLSGTRWPDILNWILRILIRGRGDLKSRFSHVRLRQIYLVTLLLMGSLLIIVILLGFVTYRISTETGWVRALAGGGVLVAALYYLARWILSLVLEWGRSVIGDAARYLDINPVNVSCRYDILRGGVEMLRKLHEEPSRYTGDDKVRYPYDRIVVVGHSLGSVIAYELLKHYWAEVNGVLPIEHEELLKETERFGCPAECVPILSDPDPEPHRYLRAQYPLWRELNRGWLGHDEFERRDAPRARWLVTDLITLGSPLAYGALLLADSVADFQEKTKLRELPLCPPDRSRHVRQCSFAVPLKEEADVGASFREWLILHHAALFAATRWANLYSPNDPISGQLRNVFGEGVLDIELRGGPKHWLKAHTSYWAPESRACLNQLKGILTDVRWPERKAGPDLTRRRLDFPDLDAVIRDAESLAAGGYDRAGRWDLAQVCGHLAAWMRLPLEGFPRPPLPIRLMLWSMRNTIGRRELRKILESRCMPSGGPTLRETVPAPGGDEAAAVERLRLVVARFQTHAGRFRPSPLFGALDRETWVQLQLIHCAHHLSFLIPRGR